VGLPSTIGPGAKVNLTAFFDLKDFLGISTIDYAFNIFIVD